MVFEFHVQIGSSTPIYQQLVDQVGLAVATGTLNTGDQLPSVRAVAELLVINPNTVMKAYGDLVRQGVVSTQPGKGLYIAERRQLLSEDERNRRLDEASSDYVHKIALLGFTPDEIQAVLERKLSVLDTPENKKGNRGNE